MATCPYCFGALTEHHKCPRGFRHRAIDALSTVGTGALVGAIAALLVNDQAPTALVIAAAALGGVLASAVRQAVGYRR